MLLVSFLLLNRVQIFWSHCSSRVFLLFLTEEAEVSIRSFVGKAAQIFHSQRLTDVFRVEFAAVASDSRLVLLCCDTGVLNLTNEVTIRNFELKTDQSYITANV